MACGSHQTFLAQNIYMLRKVLGETPAGDDYIKTVPRRGYRFAATVNETWEGERDSYRRIAANG